MSFKGYTDYSQPLKDQCIEILLNTYIDELGHHRFTSDELRDVVIDMVISDLKHYERGEEYELCLMLKDLNDSLQFNLWEWNNFRPLNIMYDRY